MPNAAALLVFSRKARALANVGEFGESLIVVRVLMGTVGMRTLASARSGNVQVVRAMLRILVLLVVAFLAPVRHHEGHADRLSKVIEFHMVTGSTCAVAFEASGKFTQAKAASPSSSTEDLTILLEEPCLPVGMILAGVEASTQLLDMALPLVFLDVFHEASAMHVGAIPIRCG